MVTAERTRTTCGVTEYAEAVIAGDVRVGRLVRLACERHMRDLDRSDLWWDQSAADKITAFFATLEHTKGEWALHRIPLRLEPWQQFVIGSAFGWKRLDAGGEMVRRYRMVLVEIGRKNGKSTVAAGVGNWLAFFDGEPGAEVYAAATKREQAKIVWTEARRQMDRLRARSPRVAGMVEVLAHNLHSPTSGSKFEPLGADANVTDGLNVHGDIVDELHAHKTRDLWDVLEEATAARRQPMHFAITTAGRGRASIWWEQREYATRVLEGVIEDDTYLPYIATLDEDDIELVDTYFGTASEDDAEAMLPLVMLAAEKSNPNLGVSVKRDYLEAKFKRARETPGLRNSTKQKHLNVSTDGENVWLDIAKWDQCAGEMPDLTGRRCFAGLDLATTTDIAALVLLFPPEDDGEPWHIIPHFWVPEAGIEQRSRRDQVPYDVWRDADLLTSTEGNVTDYRYIRHALTEMAEQYDIAEIAFDRWNATQIITELGDDGATCVGFGQGYASMNAPAKELEGLLIGLRLRHDGHAVLRWMVSNTVAEEDAAGNIKPSKAKSGEKIDGLVALVMALGRAIAHETEPGHIIPQFYNFGETQI